MPAPFPGVDPFLEAQAWEDFHQRFATALSEALTPCVRPQYLVRLEKRIYLEHRLESEPEYIRPDVSVLRAPDDAATGSPPRSGAAVTLDPVLVTLPIPEEQRESFLTIRLRDSLEVVAILELLSPANKRSGSDGRREYLAKREAVLRTGTHLVELDLLRGGERLPTKRPVPAGDFQAFVCRGNRRPRAEVYVWSLRDRLPVIPVPLTGGDPDVTLDLQAAFDLVYERAGYDYSLNYTAPIAPPLNEAEMAWVRERLKDWPGGKGR